MRIFKGLAGLLAATVFAACSGGGDDAGTPPFGNVDGDTTSAAATIEVRASADSVGTGGDEVTIAADVRDANSVGVPSTGVSFSTSTGTLSAVAATTDASGVATARFSAGSDRTNRAATITVTSGNATGSVTVAITGTKLTYSGATTFALNSTPTLTVAATDSKNNPIANLSVAIASSLGNGLSAPNVTTDNNGQASVVYTATNAGADIVQFSGGGATVSAGLTIQ